MQISPLSANLGANPYRANTKPSFGAEVYEVQTCVAPLSIDLALIDKKSSHDFEEIIELLASLPYRAYEDLADEIKSPEGCEKNYTNYENYRIDLNSRRFEIKDAEKCACDGQSTDFLNCGSIPATLILAPLQDNYFRKNITPTYYANTACASTIMNMMNILDKYITALQEDKMPSKARLIEKDVFDSMDEAETADNIITPGDIKDFYDLYKSDRLTNDYICGVLQDKAICKSLF